MAAPVIKNDVFVSYNRNDAARAELIATRLAQEAGLRVWLDKARLQPGFSWRDEIETAMNASAAALIVWGPRDLGPVQRQERDLAYAIRDTRTDFRVVYVFLPGAQIPQGTWASVDTWIRFASSLDEPDVFGRMIAALKGEAPPTSLVAELPDDPAPYRGLAAFGVEDARFFYGRTACVQEMLERLPRHPFLAVLGPSGSGKTSVVQAGLLPRLQGNATAGRDNFHRLMVRPGPIPLRALASAVTRLSPDRRSLTAIDSFLERLEKDPGELPAIIQSLLPSKGSLILVVDRLEEIFTLCEGENNRRSFLQALLALINHPHRPAWVVATMRADFYGYVSRYPDFAGEVVHHQLYIGAMHAKEVAEVIESPATQVGVIFEKGLAAQIRADAQVRGEVALPLLQHTLDLVWRKRRGRWLTWDAYKEVGGISGALRYHADRVIDGLRPDQRALARRLLLRLIWLEESVGVLAGRRVGKPLLVRQFDDPAAAERLLQHLADERLISTGETGETAELIHDSLPLHWDRLHQWVREDREFLLWRQRLRGALAEWERTQHDAGVLLRGALLAEAGRWLDERRSDLTAEERHFIEKSATLRNREQAALDRRRRRITCAALAAAIVFLTLAALAALQWRRAEIQSDKALVSQSQALSQVSRQQTDKGRATLGMLLALEALPKAGGLDRPYVASAEAALLYALFAQREKYILGGHADAVNQVRFSPKEPLVVTASRDGTARFWNMETGRIAVTLEGHHGQIYGAAFSPDGKRVVTASSDRTARLWDAANGKTMAILEGHAGDVYQASFSPDARYIATASRDGTARLWDAGTGKSMVTLTGHGGDVYMASFSPDGRRVVTASEDKTARVWRFRATGLEGQPLVLGGHSDRVVHAAFSPDGARIITASWDRTALLRDAATGKIVETLQGHKGGVNSAAFSADGKLLVTTSADGTARLWGGVTGVALAVLAGHKGLVYDADFSPDGRRLVTAADDGTARLWDVATHQAVFAFRGHIGRVWSVAFSPDGRYVATASEDDTARIWRAAPTMSHHTLDHEGRVHRACFAPDGRRLVTVSDDKTVRLWDGETGRAVALLKGHQGEVWYADFSRDGQHLVTTSTDGTARLWETDTGRPVHTLGGHEGLVNHAHFSPNGKLVVTAGKKGREGIARVWDVESGKSIAILGGHPDTVNFAAFSPDGRRIATASQDGVVRLRNAADRKLIAAVTAHRGPVVNGAFSSDSRRLATVSWDRTARLWDGATGDPLATLTGHEDAVLSVAFSPNCLLVVTGSSDNTARLWDARSGRPLLVLRGHESDVHDVSFSSDGRLILTASADRTARLWHAASGLPVATLKGHDGAVVGAAFAPDGRHVATASRDHTAKLWKLPLGTRDDWIGYARDTVPRKLSDDERRLYLGE